MLAYAAPMVRYGAQIDPSPVASLPFFATYTRFVNGSQLPAGPAGPAAPSMRTNA